MMTKIKICGLTKLEDISIINEAEPDYAGFVFAESKRQINYYSAKKLKSELSKNIKAIGVFVNEEIILIKKLCDDKIIDIIQLHGNESEYYINKLKKIVPNPIIKAVRISEKPVEINSDADYILFDTFNKNQYGGTGETFNWEYIKNYKKPFFLAGGLNSDNIKTAVKEVKPFCVDISSGAEINGGKSREKIFELINMVRSIN